MEQLVLAFYALVLSYMGMRGLTNLNFQPCPEPIAFLRKILQKEEIKSACYSNWILNFSKMIIDLFLFELLGNKS